jgi:hypothetical protein
VISTDGSAATSVEGHSLGGEEHVKERYHNVKVKATIGNVDVDDAVSRVRWADLSADDSDGNESVDLGTGSTSSGGNHGSAEMFDISSEIDATELVSDVGKAITEHASPRECRFVCEFVKAFAGVEVHKQLGHGSDFCWRPMPSFEPADDERDEQEDEAFFEAIEKFAEKFQQLCNKLAVDPSETRLKLKQLVAESAGELGCTARDLIDCLKAYRAAESGV